MKFIGIIISLLIIGYFIIDYSVSNFKLNIGGAEVPAYQTQDIKNLYTDSCSAGNYITFKNNGSDYKTNNLSKIFKINLSSNLNYYEIGYTDSPIACSGSGLSNAVVVQKQSLNATNDISVNKISSVLNIPKDKYIYINFTGSTSAINILILDSKSILN